ncbi:MAG: polysaccharide deacetylase family protein [candidate division KSB1 bacterium]|nr:polysaccharide deacetylase family protein [candidate division KSB1 bacterium]
MPKRLFRLFVSAAVWVLDSIVDGVRTLLGVSTSSRWVVLYYHTVTAQGAGAFARQMEMALRCALPVPADATVLPSGKRCFSVTFDDALVVSAEHALPVLRARGIPAAVFVPTGFVGRTAGWEMVRGCSEEAQRVMSEAELLQLDAQLVSLGSHSVTHPCLSTLPATELERELTDSRSALEAMTGREVTMFSFPYGDYDARVCAALHKTGYTRAFSITPTWVTSEQVPLVVGRVKVDPSDWPIEFFLKIRGAYRWLACASGTKAHFVPRKINGRIVAPRASSCPAARGKCRMVGRMTGETIEQGASQ